MMRTLRGRSVAALAALALLAAGCGQNKFQKEVEVEAAAVTLAREMASGGYSLITTAELAAARDSSDALLIDTMPYEDSYRQSHIPGAKNFLLPIAEMPEWNAEETGGKTQADFTALLGNDRSKRIIFYCGFVKCTRSHNGALWARKLGYTNVLRYPGGIHAWKGAGQPTESSK